MGDELERIDCLVEFDFFIHSRDHCGDDEILFGSKIEQLDAFKALIKMVLHSNGVLRLRQNMKQIII